MHELLAMPFPAADQPNELVESAYGSGYDFTLQQSAPYFAANHHPRPILGTDLAFGEHASYNSLADTPFPSTNQRSDGRDFAFEDAGRWTFGRDSAEPFPETLTSIPPVMDYDTSGIPTLRSMHGVNDSSRHVEHAWATATHQPSCGL